MKIRNLSMLALFITAFGGTSAMAAEGIIGGGPAQSCYLAAEHGWNARLNVSQCNFALAGILNAQDRAATHINRGILKLAMLDAEGSYSDFNKGLSMRGDMAEGYVDRGASLIMMRRYQEAIDEINKGISMNAKKLQIAYFDRAVAHEGLGNLQAAYEDYKVAQTIDPEFEKPAKELARFHVVVKP